MSSRTWIVVGVLSLSLVGCGALSRFAPGASPGNTIGPAATTPTQAPSPTDKLTPSDAPSPAATPSPASALRKQLDGRQFLSTLVTQDGESFALVRGTRIRLSFDDSNLGAQAGCNSLFADFRLQGDVLKVGMLGGTEMGCDEPRMAQDAWLAAFLGSSPRVSLNGNELVLDNGDTLIQLLDREIAEPDQPLVGITWVLTTLIDGETASSLPDSVVATLLFRPDGQLEVEAGCNQGGAAYSIDGDRIELEPPVLTDMACQDAAGDVERAVLRVLTAEPLTYSIDAATLTLEADGHGLQYAAALDL